MSGTKKEALLASARRLMRKRMLMPEASSGGLHIEHRVIPAGKTMPVVNYRVAIFSGLPHCNITCKEPYVQHWLVSDEDGDWMSDQPCELVQMEHELACYARGNVLIGGLGLGIVANMVATKRGVKKVTVVEKSPDVIALVGKYLPPKVLIVEADINEYLDTIKPKQFDTALIDTWQSTGEWCWQSEVVPMRRKLYAKIGRAHCWQEQIMWGQVMNMLFRAADTDEALFFAKTTCHYYAFRCGMRDLGVRKIARISANDRSMDGIKSALDVGEENQKDNTLQGYARYFLLNVGAPMWEDVFGKYWDEAWHSRDEEDVA